MPYVGILITTYTSFKEQQVITMQKTYLFYVQEQARAYWRMSPLIVVVTVLTCLYGAYDTPIILGRMALTIIGGIIVGAAVKRFNGGKLLFE